MVKEVKESVAPDKLTLELRRGTLVLAVLSQLGPARYGYALLQRLAERGLEIEQGTLYPLLRRLDEQGILESDWKVESSRPRKYYRLSDHGEQVLVELERQWSSLVEVMSLLLSDKEGE